MLLGREEQVGATQKKTFFLSYLINEKTCLQGAEIVFALDYKVEFYNFMGVGPVYTQ